jgi:hypothetical protein
MKRVSAPKQLEMNSLWFTKGMMTVILSATAARLVRRASDGGSEGMTAVDP